MIRFTVTHEDMEDGLKIIFASGEGEPSAATVLPQERQPLIKLLLQDQLDEVGTFMNFPFGVSPLGVKLELERRGFVIETSFDFDDIKPQSPETGI